MSRAAVESCHISHTLQSTGLRTIVAMRSISKTPTPPIGTSFLRRYTCVWYDTLLRMLDGCNGGCSLLRAAFDVTQREDVHRRVQRGQEAAYCGKNCCPRFPDTPANSRCCRGQCAISVSYVDVTLDQVSNGIALDLHISFSNIASQ